MSERMMPSRVTREERDRQRAQERKLKTNAASNNVRESWKELPCAERPGKLRGEGAVLKSKKLISFRDFIAPLLLDPASSRPGAHPTAVVYSSARSGHDVSVFNCGSARRYDHAARHCTARGSPVDKGHIRDLQTPPYQYQLLFPLPFVANKQLFLTCIISFFFLLPF